MKDGDLFDESFCLYDGQIIDDELFSLWRSFRKGVRVVFVADTCHSGGGIRRMPMLGGGLDVESIDAGRTLPIAMRLAADRARLELAGPVRRSRRMPDVGARQGRSSSTSRSSSTTPGGSSTSTRRS